MNQAIKIFTLPHAAGLALPAYATKGAAAFDLLAAIDKPLAIMAGERKLIPTGLTMAIAEGYEVQIRPRSGLALKHGITVLNSPGTIDSDYRGEVGIMLLNTDKKEPFVVNRGDRIAQGLLARVVQAEFEIVASAEDLGSTDRGAGGFGSTGRS